MIIQRFLHVLHHFCTPHYNYMCVFCGAVLSSELQSKYESEVAARERIEERLLATEKKKSELSVDLGQLTSQVEALRSDLQAESDKTRALAAELDVAEKRRQQLQNDAKSHVQLVSQLKNREQQLSQVRALPLTLV